MRTGVGYLFHKKKIRSRVVGKEILEWVQECIEDMQLADPSDKDNFIEASLRLSACLYCLEKFEFISETEKLRPKREILLTEGKRVYREFVVLSVSLQTGDL